MKILCDQNYSKFLFVIVFTLLIGFCSIDYAEAQKDVPNWFKQTTIFWANGQISTEEFVDAIEFLIGEGIIQVPSSQIAQTTPLFPNEPDNTTASDIIISDKSIKQMWSELESLEETISEIEPINGTQGIQGPPGEDGPKGVPGQNGMEGKDGLIIADNIYKKVETFYPKEDKVNYQETKCDSGDVLLTGTGFIGSGPLLYGSFPVFESDKNIPVGWGIRSGNQEPYRVTIYVICIDNPTRINPTNSENLDEKKKELTKISLDNQLLEDIGLWETNHAFAQVLNPVSEESLWNSIEDLKLQVQNIQPMPGQKGLQGEQGPTGEKGDYGEKGLDSNVNGKNSKISISNIYTIRDVKEVQKKTSKFYRPIQSIGLDCDLGDRPLTWGFDIIESAMYVNKGENTLSFISVVPGSIQLITVCSDMDPKHTGRVSGLK